MMNRDVVSMAFNQHSCGGIKPTFLRYFWNAATQIQYIFGQNDGDVSNTIWGMSWAYNGIYNEQYNRSASENGAYPQKCMFDYICSHPRKTSRKWMCLKKEYTSLLGKVMMTQEIQIDFGVPHFRKARLDETWFFVSLRLFMGRTHITLWFLQVLCVGLCKHHGTEACHVFIIKQPRLNGFNGPPKLGVGK